MATNSRTALGLMHHVYSNLFPTAIYNTDVDDVENVGIVWKFYSSVDGAAKYGGFIRNVDAIDKAVNLLDRIGTSDGYEEFTADFPALGTLYCSTARLSSNPVNPGVTTTQRDLMKPADVPLVYNTTASKMQYKYSDTWTDLDAAGNMSDMAANVSHTFSASAGSYSVQRNITRIISTSTPDSMALVSLEVTKTVAIGTITVTYPAAIQGAVSANVLIGFVDTTPFVASIDMSGGSASYTTPSMNVGQVMRVVAVFNP